MIVTLAQVDFLPLFRDIINSIKAGTLPDLPTIQGLFNAIPKIQGLIAASICVMGVIYLMTGLKNYKLLMMFNGAIIGTLAGGLLMVWLDKPDYMTHGMIVTGCVMGVMAWPFAKAVVILLGGSTGAVFGLCIGSFLAGRDQLPQFLVTYSWLLPLAVAVLRKKHKEEQKRIEATQQASQYRPI